MNELLVELIAINLYLSQFQDTKEYLKVYFKLIK